MAFLLEPWNWSTLRHSDISPACRCVFMLSNSYVKFRYRTHQSSAAIKSVGIPPRSRSESRQPLLPHARTCQSVMGIFVLSCEVILKQELGKLWSTFQLTLRMSDAWRCTHLKLQPVLYLVLACRMRLSLLMPTELSHVLAKLNYPLPSGCFNGHPVIRSVGTTLCILQTGTYVKIERLRRTSTATQRKVLVGLPRSHKFSLASIQWQTVKLKVVKVHSLINIPLVSLSKVHFRSFPDRSKHHNSKPGYRTPYSLSFKPTHHARNPNDIHPSTFFRVRLSYTPMCCCCIGTAWSFFCLRRRSKRKITRRTMMATTMAITIPAIGPAFIFLLFFLLVLTLRVTRFISSAETFDVRLMAWLAEGQSKTVSNREHDLLRVVERTTDEIGRYESRGRHLKNCSLCCKYEYLGWVLWQTV